MKKYIHKYKIIALTGLVSFASCTKNFQELNTNPNAVSSPTPQYIFTKAEYDGVANMPVLLLGTMQYTTSFNDVAGFGSKYLQSVENSSSASFSSAYPNGINELAEVIRAVQSDPAKVNLLAEARIWRVYSFSRLTDLYGDIPYSQAAQGYSSSNFTPAYDAQKDIYTNMLSELDAAAQALDSTKPTFGSADLIYGGSTVQWKKFAYSLMLRLGMRLTKVDLTSAQTWVTKAIAGGVILLDADVAKAPYIATGLDINKNPLALNLWNNDYIAQNGNTNQEGGKYQDVFINYLKQTNDPRLPVVSIVWNNGVPDTTSSIQQGMSAMLSSKPANFVNLSEPNPKTLLLLNSPFLVFTSAESYYLLTEAALRGWYSGASAASLYQSGITAALHQWSVISVGASNGTISQANIDAYLNNNQLNTSGTIDQQMQQLYTQFWISIFPDAEEVYCAYRRTGYPALVPNNYPGNATGGQIFRRLLYPVSEQNLNAKSYADAISRQGPDNLMTRIWWDKQ